MLQVASDRVKQFFEQQLATGKISESQLANLSTKLNIDTEELIAWQEQKSLAQIHQRLDVDDAMFLYNTIGMSTETFNSQPVHIKIIVTKVMAEILQCTLNL